MDHLAFYNAGCEPTPGLAGLKIRARRQLRRILLPMFKRLVQILASICHRLDVTEHEVRELRALVEDLRRRHEDHSAKTPATLAFGWDYVAMVRRLAVLEEHVDSLLAARNAAEDVTDLVNIPPGRFPVGSAHDPDPVPRSKVG
jgi:hypothetical protein